MAKFLFTLLFLPISLFGQIRSRVLDSLTKQPLPFATIRTLSSDQSTRNIITDSAGYFTTDSITSLQISMTGYRTATFPCCDSLYLLSTTIKTLTGVTIAGLRPILIVKPDGFLYDATQDIQAAGETTSDLLRKLPGIQVDPDGTPTMRGSSRIKVFIDGKPSEAYATTIAEALKQIPAENISRIEIITQPSARYEGEGVDGVLNIYTKRPLTDGTSGIITGLLQNRYRQYTMNAALRRRQWIFTVNANYSFENTLNRASTSRIDTAGNILTQQNVRANKLHNLYTGFGITYILDSLTNFGITYRFGISRERILTDINYDVGNDILNRYIDNPGKRRIHPLTWNFTRKSKDKKAEFTFLGNWFDQHFTSEYDLRQKSYRENSLNTTSNKELALESNFSRGGFETGVKASFRRFRNETLFIPNKDRSQEFYFPREIYGAFISQSFTLKRFYIRTGIRYEHTIQSILLRAVDLEIPDYKNFLPNILISRTLKDHKLSLSYNRRLFRPWIHLINPVINYIDSFNLSYGNPYLDPGIHNNIELAYSFTNTRWLVSNSLFWYRTLRSIEAVALLKPGGITARTYANINEYSTIGMFTQVTYRTNELTVNANNSLRYTNFGKMAGWANNIMINATYKIAPSFSVSSYLMYNSARIDFQGKTTGSRYYNFGANKIFKDGKYSLSMRIDNLFMPFQTITEINETDAFRIATATRHIRRFFRIGFSYKFGKKEVRLPAQRQMTSD